MMLAPLLAGAVLAAQPAVTGTVSYRERIALPANAELIVSLDRFGADGQTNMSELRMKLNGRQVPIQFSLPYSLGPKTTERPTYGLRARIESAGAVMFESPRHATVISNGQLKADLTLLKAAAVQMPSLFGPTWQLVELQGERVSLGSLPTLKFDKANGTVVGFTGVNSMGGTFEFEAGRVQIDPGPMTMMAGSPEQMDLETKFVAALPLVNRAAIFEGQLILSRGEKPIAVFRQAKTR